MLVSIVIPCYNSEQTIGSVVDLCIAEFDKMPGYECEFILVNDFSKDDTFGSIRRAAETHPNVRGVNLAKNFGQHAAIMAGFHYVNGDLILGMDDDLQTHPSQIPKLIAKMEEGYDVVFGHFETKKVGKMKKLFSDSSNILLDSMIDHPKGVHMNNFWLARRYVIDEVRQYRGSNAFIQLLFFRTTHNMANVDLEHFKREVGTSNYTFRKGLKQFMALIDYSIVPLRVSSVLGVLFSVLGLVAALAVIINKLLRPDVQTGWSSLMCVILILFGIGEYVGKAIMAVNQTPLFVVRETVGGGQDGRAKDEGVSGELCVAGADEV